MESGFRWSEDSNITVCCFLPEQPERRLISEAGQGIAVYRIVSISRNRAGTVPGHCSLLVLSPEQYRGLDFSKESLSFCRKVWYNVTAEAFQSLK